MQWSTGRPGGTGEDARRSTKYLLQLRVFGFGLLEEGDVGVGVFPGGEKVLIGDASLRCVTLLLIQPAQLQLSDYGRYVGPVVGFHFQDPLEILLGFSVTPSLLIGQASYVENAGIGTSVQGRGVQEV